MILLFFLASHISLTCAGTPINLRSVSFDVSWKTLYSEQAVLISVDLKPTIDVKWIAIGFSDHGKYNNSDLCVLHRDGTFLDYYVSNEFEVVLDRSQDCELVEASSNGFSFKRRFATCDFRDYAIEQGTTNFIVAASEFELEQLAGFLDNKIEKNIGYGQIITSSFIPKDVPDQMAFSFEIKANNFQVPSDLTTYWCIVEQVPKSLLTTKHHAIKMEAIVQEGHEHLVHHMEIFHCIHPQKSEWAGICQHKWRPRDSQSCSRVLAAWAKGAKAFIYPPEAGLPLGGEDFVPYIMVEIHYNNEHGRDDYVDNSGFKFTVTPNLRKYDAGVIEIGLIYSDVMSIPAGADHFALTGYCPGACSKKFPAEGINIFGSQLHAHMTGRKLWTSYYRNGAKLGEINRDNHFSPHWQHIQRLDPPVNIQPGDVLATTCVYETLERTTPTLGGYGIIDEMCVNYMYYYPLSEIEVCKSAINNATLARFFRQKGVSANITQISKKFQLVDWSEENISDLKEVYATAPLNLHCLQHDGTLFPDKDVDWGNVWRPKPLLGPFDRSPQRDECPSIND